MHLEDRGAGCERLRPAQCPDHFILLSGLRVLCLSLSCPPVGVRVDVPMPTSPFLRGPPHRLRRGRLPNIGVHWPLHSLKGPSSRLTAGMGLERRARDVASGVSTACFLSLAGGIRHFALRSEIPRFQHRVQRTQMECGRLQSAVQTDAGSLGVLLPPDLSVCVSSPRPLLPSKCSHAASC